ncbi:hypothetical protein [Roseofilum capinflatum]|uniref:Uncharacterized protein n=1 Tax=Roseofilum capinflatum BLCC-M114 TaxID=3022440 RepID=A0ABT7BB32_9CYAN|nr:hypothetical protein [Roseofilum capinflatum]MDJ1175731.1 hypothetical protein [Roseofilum capinflatum BLCC-M114]
MEYRVKAKAKLEEEFIIDDEQLIRYFGEEKVSTTDKEVLLKQMIGETENVRNWELTELKVKILNSEHVV